MTRPSLVSVYMGFADLLAQRSLDTKIKVGCVITDTSLRHVIGVGYNGGAIGQTDSRVSMEKGQSGLIHAEMNALVKCSNQFVDKIAFVTHFPCQVCARLLVNSGIIHLYYRHDYDTIENAAILDDAGITYDKVGESNE